MRHIRATMIDLRGIMKQGAFFTGSILAIILISGCSTIWPNHVEDPSVPEWRGMDVNGTVLGKLKTNASITNYRIDSSDYESIMEEINGSDPEGTAKLGANQSFSFHCLLPGLYLLSIPASSYNGSVGSPIAVESSQGNLKVKAILQGGNSQYLFSVFSIERIS